MSDDSSVELRPSAPSRAGKLASARALFRRAFRWLSIAAFFLLIAAACLEGLIELILRYPDAASRLYRPAHKVSHLKNYYRAFDRSVVQLHPDCAMHDDALVYRLRPGRCVVQNRESTVEYAVNRAGLRGAPDDLEDPEIIVLDDSHAMGWGVPGDTTVASRIGALTGRKTLNAAVSSYETVRETALLREINRPATKVVVIAYCENDFRSNWLFVANGALPAIDRAAYESRVREHLERSRYFPFKHAWRLAQLVVAPAPAPDVVPQPRPGFAAMTFLAIVDQARDLLRGRHLIVLETNGYNANNARFATALRHSAAHADLLAELASMHVIDTSSFLTDDDYYLVDDHMRASGHDKIARAIVDIINGAGRWRVVPAGETVAPAGPANGSIEAVEHKGGLTLIRGWAARRDTGQPAAAVALLRNGLKLAEAEPVQARTDIADALAKPSAGFSGYWLVVPTERLAGAQSLAVVATWPDGRVSPLEHQEKLRGGD